MTSATLEHVNITVRNAQATADLLCYLFDWQIRWEGIAGDGAGYTYHIGNPESYIALYTPNAQDITAFKKSQPLNHIAIKVDDLDRIETRVIKRGLKPVKHANYIPGRRFYFYDENNIEFEILSYNSTLNG